MNRIDKIIENVKQELLNATEKFGKFHNFHEGYAVLLEEVDELWDEIKNKNHSSQKSCVESEAIQVAAMAIRIIHDCCSDWND